MKRAGVGIAFLVAISGIAADEKVPAVKELEVKGLRAARGGLSKPTVLQSAEDLEKAVADKAARAALAKQVDFAKQQVLVFRWSGSGRDRLSAVEADGKVVFTYRRGLTRDLRPHVHAFALRKGVEYTIQGLRD